MNVVLETSCGCRKTLTAPDWDSLPDVLDVPLCREGRDVDDVSLYPLFNAPAFRSFERKGAERMDRARGQAFYRESFTVNRKFRRDVESQPRHTKESGRIRVSWENGKPIPNVYRRLTTRCGCVGVTSVLVLVVPTGVDLLTPHPTWRFPLTPTLSRSHLPGLLSYDPEVDYQTVRDFRFQEIVTEGAAVYIDYMEQEF